MVGVTLTDATDGHTPNINNTGKWMKVLDQATALCAKFWENKAYSGSKSVDSFQNSNPLVADLKKKLIRH